MKLFLSLFLIVGVSAAAVYYVSPAGIAEFFGTTADSNQVMGHDANDHEAHSHMGAQAITYTVNATSSAGLAGLVLPTESESVIARRRASGDLLPDLVSLPPRDMVIKTDDQGKEKLLFTTTYFNKGDGPLEFIPDKSSKGTRADHERDIFQRIYRADESYRDKIVGRFLWHQEHLHYHYDNFIEYNLEAVDVPNSPQLDGTKIKSTFCVRDISRVMLPLQNRPDEATYKICGKELQGVSVGWGDTYYFNYPDQAIDISNLKTGVYSLTYHINPDSRLDELRYDNNVSGSRFRIDMEKKTVEVIEEFPKSNPEVEHVYLAEPFGNVEQ